MALYNTVILKGGYLDIFTTFLKRLLIFTQAPNLILTARKSWIKKSNVCETFHCK